MGLHRYQEGQALCTRRAHEANPHRSRRRGQCHGAGPELPPAEPGTLLLRGPAVVHGLRRRQPRVHEQRRAHARLPDLHALHGHGHHPGHGPLRGGSRVGLCVHGPRRAGPVPRRRQDLPRDDAGAHPRQGILVLRRLLRTAPGPAGDRPEERRRRQPEPGPEGQPGRFLHRLVRAHRAHRQGGQLGADHARQELVGPAASLRPARTVVRKDVETG